MVFQQLTGVEVILSVPESASRMAFETYIARAGLEEKVGKVGGLEGSMLDV